VKRSAALTPLSHDHQHALDAALRLRRAEPDTLRAAVDRFQEFFENEGRRHFAIEEELLLPALPADDPEWAQASRRVMDDHAAIRATAGDVPTVAAARELGGRLSDHVRFEERTLFGLIERRLAPEELRRLGARVAAAERGR
jgi:hypothetical protein